MKKIAAGLLFCFSFYSIQAQTSKKCFLYHQSADGSSETVLIELSVSESAADVEIHRTFVRGNTENKVSAELTGSVSGEKLFFTADALSFYRKETGQSANKKSSGDETWILQNDVLTINGVTYIMTECKH